MDERMDGQSGSEQFLSTSEQTANSSSNYFASSSLPPLLCVLLPYFASSSPTLRPPPLRAHAGLRKPLCNTVTQRSAQPCVPPPTELLIATSFMALMATTSSVSPPSHGEWLHFKASSKQPSFSFLQVITLHCSSVFVTVSATVRWKKQTDGRDLFFLSYIRVDVFVCCPSHGLPAADNQARDHTEMEVNCV